MLVLSRKVGQEIQIGDHIKIVINRIGGHRVTIGIEAPRDMRIVRGELQRFEEMDETSDGEGPGEEPKQQEPDADPSAPRPRARLPVNLGPNIVSCSTLRKAR